MILALVTEPAYLSAARPRRLCPPCQADTNRWLDHTGPLHRGIQIAQVGTGAWTTPSWVRTRETVASQVRLIRDHCLLDHTCDAATLQPGPTPERTAS